MPLWNSGKQPKIKSQTGKASLKASKGHTLRYITWAAVIIMIITFLIFYFVDYSYLNDGKEIHNSRISVLFSPNVIGRDDSITIKTVALLTQTPPASVKITVFGPAISDRSVLLFAGNTTSYPKDFGLSEIGPGNYFISAVDADSNSVIGIEDFRVSQFPDLAYIFEFASAPTGITVMGGIVAAVVGAFYQERVRRKELEVENKMKNDEIELDRRKRKADWLTSNMLSYFDLAVDSKEVADLFEFDNNVYILKANLDHLDLLAGIARFYKSFKNYDSKTGIYFFDNYKVEDFLSELQDQTLRTISRLVGDREFLVAFFECKYRDEITKADAFRFSTRIKHALEEGSPHLQYLCKCTLVYYWVLQIEINKVLQVTYTDGEKILADLEKDALKHEKAITDGLESINVQIYKEVT